LIDEIDGKNDCGEQFHKQLGENHGFEWDFLLVCSICHVHSSTFNTKVSSNGIMKKPSKTIPITSNHIIRIYSTIVNVNMKLIGTF